MPYIKPDDVISPKNSFRLLEVLHDDGEGSYSICIGFWDKKITLFLRWNGTEKLPLGNPQSRGLSTWLVIPDDLTESVLNMEKIPADRRKRAKTLLENT
jgi:hypothetical protein